MKAAQTAKLQNILDDLRRYRDPAYPSIHKDLLLDAIEQELETLVQEAQKASGGRVNVNKALQR